MTQSQQRSRPVMGRRTSFHSDQARGQITEERQHLTASKGSAQDHSSAFINAVKLEDVLCNIKANSRNTIHGGWLLLRV